MEAGDHKGQGYARLCHAWERVDGGPGETLGPRGLLWPQQTGFWHEEKPHNCLKQMKLLLNTMS